jgi:hypothetical protein
MISAEDYASLSDFLGRYCWLVDNGDADAWVALWTEDGAFVGLGSQPLVGHEQLKTIPRLSAQAGPGTLRHMVANLHGTYGETRDVVHARMYNYVSDWSTGGAPRIMAVCEVTLLRDGGYWKMQRNVAKMLRALT